jgi:hypothetical protein
MRCAPVKAKGLSEFALTLSCIYFAMVCLSLRLNQCSGTLSVLFRDLNCVSVIKNVWIAVASSPWTVSLRLPRALKLMWRAQWCGKVRIFIFLFLKYLIELAEL